MLFLRPILLVLENCCVLSLKSFDSSPRDARDMLLFEVDLLRTRFRRGELAALTDERMAGLRLFDAGEPPVGVGLYPNVCREADRGDPPCCAESERALPLLPLLLLRAGDGLERRYRGGVM